MKKRMITALLGGTVMLGAMGGSADAKTYAYDLGDGSVRYIYSEPAGKMYTYVETDEGVSEEDGEQGLTEQEKKDLENWHKADMQQAVAYVEKYGVSYDADNDSLYYQGKKVRWLIDKQFGDTYTALRMPDGEIDLYTERADDYRLTGVRIATQEEYDERTRSDQEAEGSVIYSVVTNTDGVSYSFDTESEGEAVIIPDGPQVRQGIETAVESGADDPWAGEEKAAEYAKAGIGYDSQKGQWLWGGRPIYYLMDEDGGLYQCGAEEAKENKIYVIVRRNADGSVKEAVQLTAEEVLKEKILQDAQ